MSSQSFAETVTTHLVLDTRILSLSVLSNKDSVHIIVWRLEALDGNARPHVGKEIEGTAQREVQGYVPLANWKCGSG